MKNIVGLLAIASAAVMVTAPAYAVQLLVPEPMSMSLVGGGIVAIAAIRHMRRKR